MGKNVKAVNELSRISKKFHEHLQIIQDAIDSGIPLEISPLMLESWMMFRCCSKFCFNCGYITVDEFLTNFAYVNYYFEKLGTLSPDLTKNKSIQVEK